MRKLLLFIFIGIVGLVFITPFLIADDPKSIEPFIPKWRIGLKWKVECTKTSACIDSVWPPGPDRIVKWKVAYEVTGEKELFDYAAGTKVLCWEVAVKEEREKTLYFYVRKGSFTVLAKSDRSITSWYKDRKWLSSNDYGNDVFFTAAPGPERFFILPKFPKECKDEVRKIDKRSEEIPFRRLALVIQEVKFPNDETMEVKLTLRPRSSDPFEEEEGGWSIVVWQRWKKGKPWWVEYRREEYDEDGRLYAGSRGRVEARLVEEEPTSKDDSDKDDGKDEKDSAKDNSDEDSDKNANSEDESDNDSDEDK